MAYDLATRAQVVTLKAYGLSSQGIEQSTGVCVRTINRIFSQAVARGFDPSAEPCKVLNLHVHGRRRVLSHPRPCYQANLTLSPPPSSPSIQSMRHVQSGMERDHSDMQRSPEHDMFSASPEPEPDESRAASAQSSSASDIMIDGASPVTAAPLRHHPTRYLQAQEAMSPWFTSLVQSNAFAIVVWTGDGLVRDDALHFLRHDLPSWNGIWNERQTLKPSSGDSSLAQVTKMSKCVSLLERRSKTDFLRLRFHRLLQYQAFARCLAETQMTPRMCRKAATTLTINRILQRIHANDWSTMGDIDKKRRREAFRAQRRAGKRLQIFCNHMGYGFLLLSSRTSVGKMCVALIDPLAMLNLFRLENRFTDEMFHALVCYVCNMFPEFQSLCGKLDTTVRRLAWDAAGGVSDPQLSIIATEMEDYLEARKDLEPPPNFIGLELSDALDPL